MYLVNELRVMMINKVWISCYSAIAKVLKLCVLFEVNSAANGQIVLLSL